MSHSSRRQFLELGTAAVAAAALGRSYASESRTSSSSLINLPFTPLNPQMGLIGTGGRGTSLLGDLLAADVQVNALCDIVPEKAQHAQALVEKSGQKPPALYTNGDHAFEALVSREDLDLVVIATPWRWHTTMAVAVMEKGKHAFTEVPAATTLEDCWRLV